jgi:mercuric reductase
MSTQEHYDLLILGSGSTAFAAAIHAQELGKTAVMIEGRTLGGTCVNRGCLPSKNLIEAARLVYAAAHPRYPGLTPARLDVDFPALIAQKDEVIREYRDQHYEGLVDDTDEEGQPPIQVVPGQVAFVDPHTVLVTAPDGTSRRLAGSQVLIATGSSPLIPDIPGLSETPYLTSDLLISQEEVELTELPRSLLILGGGYIALDGPTRRVVGVSMLGVNAGEVIHEAAMALRFGATTDDFIDLIHVYPTMAEALKIVAISFTKDVNRLSCCAT